MLSSTRRVDINHSQSQKAHNTTFSKRNEFCALIALAGKGHESLPGTSWRLAVKYERASGLAWSCLWYHSAAEGRERLQRRQHRLQSRHLTRRLSAHSRCAPNKVSSIALAGDVRGYISVI